MVRTVADGAVVVHFFTTTDCSRSLNVNLTRQTHHCTLQIVCSTVEKLYFSGLQTYDSEYSIFVVCSGPKDVKYQASKPAVQYTATTDRYGTQNIQLGVSYLNYTKTTLNWAFCAIRYTVFYVNCTFQCSTVCLTVVHMNCRNV